MYKKEKEKCINESLNTRDKRTNKQREGITRCEFHTLELLNKEPLKKQAAGTPNYPHP